jgi:hypothetical protein
MLCAVIGDDEWIWHVTLPTLLISPKSVDPTLKKLNSCHDQPYYIVFFTI